MQEFLGVLIFIVVLVLSAYSSVKWFRHNLVHSNDVAIEFFKKLILATVIFFIIYVAMFIFFGVLWIIAWVGTFLREIAMWFYESLLYPFLFFF